MLAIETLAIAIRSNQNIVGIEINNIESKIGLFADDIIVMIVCLKQSIFHLLNIISIIGNVWDYKMNENQLSISSSTPRD